MTEEEKQYMMQQTFEELQRQALGQRLYNEMKHVYDRQGMSILQSQLLKGFTQSCKESLRAVI